MATVKATLDHQSSGANNDIRFEAQLAGPTGNDISVQLTDPETANASLQTSVDDEKISITLATDGSENITTTAQDIAVAVDNDADAFDLVNVVLTEGDGSGVVEPLTEQNLSGGLYSFEYRFRPNDRVYVIEDVEAEDSRESGIAIQKGKVIRVFSEVLVNSTFDDNLMYDVRVDGRTGTNEFNPDDVFATLSDAVQQYEQRVK